MDIESIVRNLSPTALDRLCRAYAPQEYAEACGEQLVGYYTAHDGAEVSPDEATAALLEVLPATHVPRHLVPLAAMPRLPNGKVDVRELAARPLPPGADAPGPAPSGDLERWVRGLWGDVLGVSVQDIGADAGFFHLGGASLDALKVSNRLARVLGREVPPVWLLRRPRLEEYARTLRDECAGVAHFAEICAVAAAAYDPVEEREHA